MKTKNEKQSAMPTFATIMVRPSRKNVSSQQYRCYRDELRRQILDDEAEMRAKELDAWCWEFMARCH